MACPYFHGVKACGQTDHSATAMLPLGDAWEGVCRTPREPPWEPDPSTLLSLCNLGYARGVCPRFPPADEGPDAVRFTVVEDNGVSLRLYYVLERDHLPLAHGPLEFSRENDSLAGTDDGGAVHRLARHYVDSYLRRKTEASGSGAASG